MKRLTASPNYRWWVVFMLWFVCFFNYADRLVLAGVLPKLEEEFKFTKEELGYISSAFMVVYAGMAPFAGLIGDRFRRKTLILGGFFFWSIITLATGWARSFWQFYFIRAAEGFGEAFYFPASLSLVSDYHPPKTRSRALSFHQSSVYLGTIGGSVVGGWFAETMNWRGGFYVFGLCGMILAVLLAGMLVEPNRGQSEMADESPAPQSKPPLTTVFRDIFRTWTAPTLIMGFIAANFVAASILTWMPTYLHKKFNLGLAQASLNATLYIQLASAVGAPLSGLLADVLSARMRGGRMLVQAAGLGLGSVFLWAMGAVTTLAWLIPAMITFGLCKGLYDANIFASMYDVVHPRSRATVVGLMNAAAWGAGAVAQPMIGRVLDHGGKVNEIANMSYALEIGGGVYLIGAAFLILAGILLARRDVKTSW